jgi:hypothetical protein
MQATTFQLRPPLAVSNGFVADIDPRVQQQLDTLHGLLSADLFTRPTLPTGGGQSSPTDGSTPSDLEEELERDFEQVGAEEGEPPKRARRQPRQHDGLNPADVLPLALTPQRAGAKPTWDPKSLAAKLERARQDLQAAKLLDGSGQSTSPDLISLSEYVDRISNLSTLKYNLDDALSGEWNTYPESVRRVLDNGTYPAFRVYLVAYAYTVLQLSDVGAVKKFILSDRLGVRALIDYATIGAARELVADKGFNIANYNDDAGDFVEKVRAAQVGMSTASFESDVMTVVNDLINDVAHKDLIDKAEKTLGTLPLQTRLLLARYIDAAPVTITPANIVPFAAVWLAQNAPPPAASPTDTTAAGPSDSDFDIETYPDDPSSIQISVSAVLCAGQLYYTMVLGDELDVFSIVHYFTHKYLVNGLMEVTDPVLRTDLQNYVFSSRFTDLKTGRLLDRSRPAERGMFYKQVFDLGHGQVPEDLIVNDDFPTMWKTLMLQSATYLEKAQQSLNPGQFVSKQQVTQAVQDLQYNLSTHCIGMATVATPMMFAELNFCIRRILMHPEVLKQVVPIGGTWWRVVERLYMDIKQTRPRSTALYQKAQLGHNIIVQIANYDPATFEDDTSFSGFISDVDAYITTQSILQQALTDDLKRRQEDAPATGVGQPPGDGSPAGAPATQDAPAIQGAPQLPAAPQVPVPVGVGGPNGASANGHVSSDEWDF